MTTSPLEPDSEVGHQEIAAADPGQGAPDTAYGFGPSATGLDVILPHEDAEEEPET